MKRNPATELSDAKRQLHAAYEECPHWDYDEDGAGHDCCDVVASAKERVARARRRVKGLV